MTAVIEVFVCPDAWPIHSSWAGLLLIYFAHGGGNFTQPGATNSIVALI
jgi:putative oxidoreductase